VGSQYLASLEVDLIHILKLQHVQKKQQAQVRECDWRPNSSAYFSTLSRRGKEGLMDGQQIYLSALK
jgi:hypothetical protein